MIEPTEEQQAAEKQRCKTENSPHTTSPVALDSVALQQQAQLFVVRCHSPVAYLNAHARNVSAMEVSAVAADAS